MKKWTIAALCICILLLSACSASGNKMRKIEKELGVKVPRGTIVTTVDSHGGFHGDGVLHAMLWFEEEAALEQIRQSNEWKELPLSKNLQALVYGAQTEDGSIGPYITMDDDAGPIISDIQNGYYFFRDRHSRSTDPASDANVLTRGSFNLTLAIYDVDSHTLHYIELDT